MYSGSPLTPEVVVDENWFSDEGFCKETKVRSTDPFHSFFRLMFVTGKKEYKHSVVGYSAVVSAFKDFG